MSGWAVEHRTDIVTRSSYPRTGTIFDVCVPTYRTVFPMKIASKNAHREFARGLGLFNSRKVV
jgi:hypothetical protein